MNARTLLAVAVAASVLLAGAVAAGAATPAEPANDNATDAADADENATDGNEAAADAGPPSDVPAADAGNDSEATQGPPSELPGQVPDHVGEIHDKINSFLNGDIGNLGDALGGMLGDDGEQTDDEQAAENATA